MKEIICEMCGSNDIVKQDGVYVCQSCGTKYSPEEAKKLMVEGTVTIDKSSEKDNLKTLAKRYYNNQEWEKADDYYDRIIELDPHDWEAVYYGGLASAQRSTFNNLRLDEAIIGAENALTLVEPDEKEKYFKIFRSEVIDIALGTYNFIARIGNDNEDDFLEGDMGTYLNDLVNLVNNFDRILESFPVDKVTINDETWNIYMCVIDCSYRLKKSYMYHWGHDGHGSKVHRHYPSEEYQNFGRNVEAAYLEKIKKIDPEFEPPKIQSGGCYVATCVYGSYDCPEVWTLRRFRDNTLRQSIFGRTFIKCYYATSPTIVKYFGDYKVFNSIFKPVLDKFVNKLQNDGVDSTMYIDE